MKFEAIKKQKGYSSISTRIGLNMLLVLAIAVPFLFLLEYKAVSDIAEQEVSSKLAEIELSLSQTLGVALWNLDDEAIHEIGKAHINNELIAHLTIKDHNNEAYFNQKKSESKETKEFEIYYNQRLVGSIELGIDRNYRENLQKAQFIKDIVLITVAILLTSIGSLILTRRLTKPMMKLADEINTFAKKGLEKPLTADLVHAKYEIGYFAKTFEQMRQELREKILKNEKLVEEKSRLFGQLAHDLKTPLVPIIGMLPELIKDEKDNDKKEALTMLNNNAKRLHMLIKNILTLIKLESRIIFSLAEMKPIEFVEKIIENNEYSFKQKNISIKKEFDKDLPKIFADESYLSEVLENFIANAIKFSKENTNFTFIVRKDDEYIDFALKDQGEGIEKKNIGKIFDEFFKEDWSRHQASSGLGLSISKRIITGHAGKIYALSDGKGKGSTFGFKIPHRR